MNTRSRKTKGFSQRLIALLLCGVCLLSASPVSAMASEVEAPQTAEESTTVVVEAVPQTQTEDQELTRQESDQELPAADPQKEAAEQENVQQEPVEVAPAVSLYDRLMACTTVEEVNAILDCLTPEEEAELDAFTAEQQNALTEKIASLGAYGATPLADVERTQEITIQAGQNGTISATVDRNSFTAECSESGITAARSNGNSYTITVDSSVKPGDYILTARYSATTTSGGWWNQTTTTTNYVDTVTVHVTEASRTDKNVKLNAVLNHTIATYAYYENGAWHWGEEYQPGSTFSIYYNGDSSKETIEYIVYFAKPEEDYLLTNFTIKNELSSTSGQQSFDLYSVDRYDSSKIKDFPDLANLVQTAKANKYLTMNGYTTSAAADSDLVEYTHYFNAVKPTLAVTAVPNKQEVKPGDTVTFTVTVKPEVALASGQTATVQQIKVSSLEINGKVYQDVTLNRNSDGTYTTTVDYTATAADWTMGLIELKVDADVTYQYVLPVQDRDNVTSEIQTVSTVDSSGKAQVRLASDYGVGYELRFDPATGITPPASIPAAPVDPTRYYEGQTVTVLDYNRAPVDDPANGGTWTFTGWEYGDKKDYTKDDTIKMGTQGILLVGVWKFEEYPNRDLSVQKTLSGNMYNANDTFTFTVTYNDKTETFDLGKDQTNTLSIPVGATVTITENPGTYTSSIAAVTPNTLEYTAITNGITFVMPAENVKVVINNHNEQTVETGVLLDSLPYVLILGLVVAGAVLLIGKRRNRYED